MYRGAAETSPARASVEAKVARPAEDAIWTDVLCRGWLHEFPGPAGFIRDSGAISAARSLCRKCVVKHSRRR
jgi:hypothetical protein